MIYLFYKVRKEDIYAIKFLLEGFENWMIVSTIDEELCKIQISIASDFLEDCKKIIEDLRKKFLMIPLDESYHISQGHF